MMSTVNLRNANFVVEWDKIKRTLQILMKNAALNIKDTWPRCQHIASVRLRITIEGDQQYEWQVAKVVIGTYGAEEMLFAKKVLDEHGTHVTDTDYILVIIGSPSQHVGHPVPKIARLKHLNPIDNGTMPPTDDWLNDWDEALVCLREEAIMRRLIK